MTARIRYYMERHAMSEWREPLWVAVSGGVDSMVLLRVLQELRHPCHVIHIDHGLRGAESDADLSLVKEYCMSQGLPFRSEKVDVADLAAQGGISIQMAARELRYEVFRKLTQEGPKKLALAHHQDDAIETLFIQMMHGMGLHGWRTIPPVSGPFIRPFLATSRAEIMDYAGVHGVPYREDRSNADPKYLRNRIRHELLPMLENWRPGVRRSLARTVELFREMAHLTEEQLSARSIAITEDQEGVRSIPITVILEHGTPRLMLHRELRQYGFHPDRLEDILLAIQASKTGAAFRDGGYDVLVDRDHLVISPVSDAPRSWSFTSLDELPKDLPLHIELMKPQDIDTSSGAKVAWLDADKLRPPFLLRPWKAGDRMRPIGLKGTKLISDILIDAKVSRKEKATTYVLESNGTIVWLLGHRIAEAYQAGAASENVLRLSWKG